MIRNKRVTFALMLLAGLFLLIPGTARAQESTTDFAVGPTYFYGGGICVGQASAQGKVLGGAQTHGVNVAFQMGIHPLGEWGSALLSCPANLIVDWRNVDTGASGTLSYFHSNPSGVTQAIPIDGINVDTGPGAVDLTLRTDGPNLPATTRVIVP